MVQVGDGRESGRSIWIFSREHFFGLMVFIYCRIMRCIKYHIIVEYEIMLFIIHHCIFVFRVKVLMKFITQRYLCDILFAVHF